MLTGLGQLNFVDVTNAVATTSKQPPRLRVRIRFIMVNVKVVTIRIKVGVRLKLPPVLTVPTHEGMARLSSLSDLKNTGM